MTDPTRLFIEAGRLNDRLAQASDALVSDLGLTSARWQVLGVVVQAAAPATVSHLARIMGLARQSVQRVVNDLVREGFCRTAENPRHARAPLILATEKGEAAYRKASARREPWARSLTTEVSEEEARTALKVLKTLNRALFNSASAGSQARSD